MKYSIKILFAFALACTVALNANAQFEESDDNRVPDRFHMGFHMGSTFSSLYGSNLNNVEPLWFPTAGIHADFQVAPIPFFVGVGLNYANPGYRDTHRYDSYLDQMEAYHSIHMPITASYHFNIAPNLFINPFTGVFMAYDLTDIGHQDFYEKHKQNLQLDDNRFSYGLRVGCGINFGRLTLDLGYDWGLKDLGKGGTNTAHNGTLFMTVGINWAGSR